MTREEVIEILKQYREKPTLINEIESVDEAVWLDEALEMTIKALEQEPCEDCISRQAAMVAIRNQYPGIPFVDVNGARKKWAEKYAQYRECEKIIESFPSVQPVRSKGEWERVTDKTGHLVWECKCGWQERLSTNFCPNCGAKMEGDTE